MEKKKVLIRKRKVNDKTEVKVKLSLSVIFLVLMLILLLIPAVSADYTRTSNYNLINGGIGNLAGGFFGETAGQFDRSMCQAGQDFVLQIAPGGCSPAVVRSDLLEEQNAPIYCQIAATQINPLIDVKAIDWITFSGQTPSQVAGVSFFPNNAALGTGRGTNFETTLGTSPILSNVGYAVIVLKRQPNESAMPDYVEGNLTAKIRYNIENAWGVGQASYYLPLMDENKFNDRYKSYGFWDGRGFLKADSIDVDSATISVYSGKTSANSDNRQKIHSETLQKGKASGKIYMTGFNYCLANMKIRLDDITYPYIRAKIRVNADVIEVADEETFLEGKCKITNIEKHGVNEKVDVKCSEDSNSGFFGSKTFELKIAPRIVIEVNGQEKTVGLGDFVGKIDDKKSMYVGYIGSEKDTNRKENLQMVLVVLREEKEKLDEDTLNQVSGTLGSLYEDSTSPNSVIAWSSNRLKGVVAIIYRGTKYVFEKDNSYKYLKYSETQSGTFNWLGVAIMIKDFASAVDAEITPETRDYYEKAIDDYDEVLSSFASESYKSVNLGKDALVKKIDLAKSMQQRKTLVELCNDFKKQYSNERIPESCSEALKLSSWTSSSRSVIINGKTIDISLDGIYKPSYIEYGISGTVTNIKTTETDTFYLRKNEIKYLSEEKDKTEYFQLAEIKDENSVNLLIDVIGVDHSEKMEISPVSRTLKKNIAFSRGNYKIIITEIKLERVAKVSVLPSIDYSGTETKIKFKIGIEKRSNLLKLSPEQAKNKANSINESVKKMEKISSDLGKTVTGLKTACYATGTFFIFENLVTGFNAKGLARQKVMRDSGGWYDKCGKWKTEKIDGESYKSLQDCLFENSDKIEKDVERYYKILSAQNEDIEKIGNENLIKEGGLFSEKTVNSTALLKQYSQEIQSKLKICAGTEFKDPIGNRDSIKIDEINKALSFENWNTYKNYNFEQLRDIGFYCDVLKQTSDDVIAKQKLYSLLFNVKQDYDNREEKKVSTPSTQPSGMKGVTDRTYGTKDSIQGEYDGGTAGPGLLKEVSEGVPVQGVIIGPNKYYFVLEQSHGNDYRIKQVYDESGNLIDGEKGNEIGKLFSKFVRTDAKSYEYKWENPYVKYYETEPYKGYPAIVPVDSDNGWYAGLKQTLPIGSSIRTADASGRVYSYYLCHVGSDGKPNFFEDGFGGDKCQMIVADSAVTYSVFSGLSTSKVSNLVKKAKEAIISAQKGYSAGAKKVIITGVGSVDVESPATEVLEIECEDFMSPNQCKILFNVCDPVVCPSSRCNLGGAYEVSNVIQSGLIGSLVLCLPNIQEGIYIPVCLTGVKAGLDNIISIQKAYRDCLQEQISTGKTIGICDEIQSIYLCEMGWREGLPIAKAGASALVNLFIGKARGGGEYLGVADAFARAEKSVQYFTQYYADDSFKAFKARSTDEVGGEVCKNFFSAVYPSSGNMLDALTKPDSPVQFTGNFEEIPFTTATNPPASHYKVFYHIYAGTDSGAYFRVYLKGSPGSSYYQDTAVSRVVDYGYVEKGGYKPNTVDFTAPSGYSTLCILVNGQEECGFKQVSTDFTINYLKEKYLQEQSTTKVTSEAECISGTPSLYSLLNPNLQEGIGNVINPELYNSGIYRICATDNPGIGTNPARWRDVGYCGDAKVRCWIDEESVKKVIKNTDIEASTVEQINKQMQEKLATAGELLNLFESTEKEINNLQDDKQKIIKITNVLEKFYQNSQKGWLMIMRGDAYGRLASVLFDKMNQEKTLAGIKVLCIMNSETGRTWKVSELKASFKTNDDLNKWCNENGQEEVCEGKSGSYTDLKKSAMFECPSGDYDASGVQISGGDKEIPGDRPIDTTIYLSPVLEFRYGGFGGIPLVGWFKGVGADSIYYQYKKGYWYFSPTGKGDFVLANSGNSVPTGFEAITKALGETTSYPAGLNELIKDKDNSNSFPNAKLSTPNLKSSIVEYTGHLQFSVKTGIYTSLFEYDKTKQKWKWFLSGASGARWYDVPQIPAEVSRDYLGASKDTLLVSLINSLDLPENKQLTSDSSVPLSAARLIFDYNRDEIGYLIADEIIEVKIFLGYTFDTISDDVYKWNGVKWNGVSYPPETKRAQKIYESKILGDGLNFIKDRVFAEQKLGTFKKVELSCRGKEKVIFTKMSVNSAAPIDVVKKITDEFESFCGYNFGTSTTGICSTQAECQKVLGNEIIKIAREIKSQKGISDTTINSQTGAKNFECLILQLAYQESSISHCGKIDPVTKTVIDFQKNGDPLYCDGKTDDVLASNAQSFGIMQLNIKYHQSNTLYDFLANINEGINSFALLYNVDPKTFTCTNKQYSGWTRALRAYNGWGCSSTGDNNYVENVLNKKDEIEALFPEVCGSGETNFNNADFSTTGQTVIEVKTTTGEPVTGNVVAAAPKSLIILMEEYLAQNKPIIVPATLDEIQIYTTGDKNEIVVLENNQKLDSEIIIKEEENFDETVPKEVNVIGELPAAEAPTIEKLEISSTKLDSILKNNNIGEKEVIVSIESSPKPIPPTGKMEISNNYDGGIVVVKNKLGIKLLEIPIKSIDNNEVKLDSKKPITCENAKENSVAKLEGSKYTCNPTANCREGFNLGELNCGSGNSCCRPTCESAYPGFQCTNTNQFSCVGDIRKGYCPGGTETVCCQRGTAVVSSTASFTSYPLINKKIQEMINGDQSFAEKLQVCEGTNCAGFVGVTFDYLFGAGRRFITGIVGNAWNIPANVKSMGGNYIFYDLEKGQRFTDYNSLKPGDVIGFYYTESNFKPEVSYQDIGETKPLTGEQRGNTKDINLTHVGLYLGKTNGQYYIIHFIHDDGIRIESLENLLENSEYKGKMFIRAIVKINQNNLYKEVPKYNTLEYGIKSGDSIKTIASKIENGLSINENSWLISNYNNILEPNYLNAGDKIFIPVSSTGYSVIVSLTDVKLYLYENENLKKEYNIVVGADCDPSEAKQCELQEREKECSARTTKAECLEEIDYKPCDWGAGKCFAAKYCIKTGDYEICQKLENREAAKYGHPLGFDKDSGNPFGPRWNRLCERIKGQLINTPFGIHGTSSAGDFWLSRKDSSFWKGLQSVGGIFSKEADPDFASHGCVRMANSDAIEFYSLTKSGTNSQSGTKVKVTYDSFE